MNFLFASRTRTHAAAQPLLQRSAGGTALSGFAPALVHDVLQSPGQPLDRSTRAAMESRFSHDFSRVRVHSDARAAASAKAVSALAYTVGRDVVFGPDRYAPLTGQGQKLLAHELAHVVQQGDAAFRPGPALGVAAAGGALERQAQSAALSNTAARSLAGSAQSAGIVQRAVDDAVAQTAGDSKDTEDNACAGWLSDPESTTKRAAETYVRGELVGDRGVVERIECDTFLPNGGFACTAHFSDGTPIRVLVKTNEIIVSVAPINSMNPPPDRPLCWYDFKCVGPNRDLVLTKRKCQSSKSAGSAPPATGGRGPNP